jgi:hypothetical protein
VVAALEEGTVGGDGAEFDLEPFAGPVPRVAAVLHETAHETRAQGDDLDLRQLDALDTGGGAVEGLGGGGSVEGFAGDDDGAGAVAGKGGGRR